MLSYKLPMLGIDFFGGGVIAYGSFLAGAAFLYVGISGGLNLTTLALGVALLLLGIWGLRSAYRAGRNLRSISKA